MLTLTSVFNAEGRLQGELTVSRARAGLRRHRRALEAIGISKVLLRPGACVSWDDLDERLD